MDAVSLDESDGILGLAHHYDDGPHAKEGHTFMATLFQEHPHMKRQFSLFLTGMDDRPSKIVFGDPHIEQHAKESFTYGKAYYMAHTDLWLTSVYSIGFSRTGIERVFPTSQILGAPALVDSGSSLIVLKPDIWDGLIQELSHHLLHCRIEDTDGSVAMCNCPKEFHKIPSLVINLIDQDDLERPLCMSAEEYILKSVDPVTGNSMCVPAIQRGNSRQPVPLIFGMTFMRAFYTTFDLENRRIGFARNALSALPAHADCTVHNKNERQFWLLTIAFVSVAISFAVYLCCCGDIGGCCGWPSCEATKPCYGYSNLEKDNFEKLHLTREESHADLSESKIPFYAGQSKSSTSSVYSTAGDSRPVTHVDSDLGIQLSHKQEVSLNASEASADTMLPHLAESRARPIDLRPARPRQSPRMDRESRTDDSPPGARASSCPPPAPERPENTVATGALSERGRGGAPAAVDHTV
jgi:hypothetical protein